DAIQPVSTLYSVPVPNSSVKDRISEFAATAGETADEAFLESHLLEIFAILHTPMEDAELQSDKMSDGESKKAMEEEVAVADAPAAIDSVKSTEVEAIEDLTDGQRGAVDMLTSELQSDDLDRSGT